MQYLNHSQSRILTQHAKYVFSFEKLLNILMGIFIYNNLYSVSNYFGLSLQLSLLIILLVCSYYFLKRFNLSRIINSIYAQIGLFFVVFSSIFGVIEAINGTKLVPNDIYRTIILIIYFSWTASLYTSINDIHKYLYILCLLSLFLLIIEFFLQTKYPEIMQSLINQEYIRSESRVYGTIGNANVYAINIAANLSIIWICKKNKIRRLLFYILLLISLIIINYTGSRVAIILWLFLALYILLTQYRESHIKSLYIFGVILLILIVMRSGQHIVDSIIKNDTVKYETVLKRLLSDEKSIQLANTATQIRLNSFRNAIKFSYRYYKFLWGPGIMAFYSLWEEKVGQEYPHMGLLFLVCQYGFFSIFPIFLMIRLFNISLKKHLLLLYIIYIIQFMFGATTMYYFLAYLLIFSIQFIRKPLKVAARKSGLIEHSSASYGALPEEL